MTANALMDPGFDLRNEEERARQGQSYFRKGPQAAIWSTQQGSYMWNFCIVQINKYCGGVRAPGMWSFSAFTLLFFPGLCAI